MWWVGAARLSSGPEGVVSANEQPVALVRRAAALALLLLLGACATHVARPSPTARPTAAPPGGVCPASPLPSAQAGAPEIVIPPTGAVRDAIASAGGFVATSAGSDDVQIWSLKYRAFMNTLRGVGKPLAWTPEGDLVVQRSVAPPKGSREPWQHFVSIVALDGTVKKTTRRDSPLRGMRLAAHPTPAHTFLGVTDEASLVWISADLASVTKHWFQRGRRKVGDGERAATYELDAHVDGDTVDSTNLISHDGRTVLERRLDNEAAVLEYGGISRELTLVLWGEEGGQAKELWREHFELKWTDDSSSLEELSVDLAPDGEWLQLALSQGTDTRPFADRAYHVSRRASDGTWTRERATEDRSARLPPRADSTWTAPDGTRFTVSAQEGLEMRSLPKVPGAAPLVYRLGQERLAPSEVRFEGPDALRYVPRSGRQEQPVVRWDLTDASARRVVEQTEKAVKATATQATECRQQPAIESSSDRALGWRATGSAGDGIVLAEGGGIVLTAEHEHKIVPKGKVPPGWGLAPPDFQRRIPSALKWRLGEPESMEPEPLPIGEQRICQRRIAVKVPPSCASRLLASEAACGTLANDWRVVSDKWIAGGGIVRDLELRTIGKNPFPVVPRDFRFAVPASSSGKLAEADSSFLSGRTSNSPAVFGLKAPQPFVLEAPNGERVLVVDPAKRGARFYALPSGEEIATWTAGGSNQLAVHAFVGARDLVVGESDGTLRRLVDGKEAARGKLTSALTELRFAPDASFFVGKAQDGSTRVVGTRDLVERARGDSGLGVISPRGDWLAVEREDEVRLYRTQDLKLRATLISFEDDEHIAYTPAGAYAGRSEAATRVTFRFGDRQLSTFDQFDATYHRPDVVAGFLRGERSDLTARPAAPPELELTGPVVVAKDGDGPTRKATVTVRASSTRQVSSVHAFVEGRPAGPPVRVCAREATVPLAIDVAGNQRVTVVAFDDAGFASVPVELDVDDGRAQAHVSTLPSLFVVSVGVSRYPHLPAELQLELADDDARAIAETFRERASKGGGYAKVHPPIVLTDDAATPSAIRAALAKLSEMTPRDVAVVFFAGHGFKTSAQGDMVFATGSVRLDGTNVSERSVAEATVGWKDISESLKKAKGRVLVLLDACHSGHITQGVVVQNDALAESLSREHRSGAIVFAAAKGRQVSYEPAGTRGLVLDTNGAKLLGAGERGGEPHGFFTAAVLRSLRTGEGDTNHDHRLSLSELVRDVSRRVHAATGGAQTPWVARRELFGDFSLVDVPKAPGRN